MSRYNRHRRDSNHKEIVDCLKKLRCGVRDCSQLGDSGCDLIVGLLGRDYQVEIKQEGEVLRAGQEEWHNAWPGQKPVVLWSVVQAIAWVEQERRRIISGFKQ